MRAIERSTQRDAGLAAMLPHVGLHGWSVAALRQGLRDLGTPESAADWLFAGPAEMVEAYIDLADRRMAAAAPADPSGRLTERVRALILLRLQQSEPEREAVRRAASLLSLPGHAAPALRSLARTVDAIWIAAGDRSANWSWYTKRASLAAVYGATLLHWLGGAADTDAFLDRRLADLGRIGRLRGRRVGGPAAADTQTQPPPP